MKMTVDLPDDVLLEANRRAARERRSVNAIIVDAVRLGFARSAVPEPASPNLPTFGSNGVLAGVVLDDSAALLESMERRG